MSEVLTWQEDLFNDDLSELFDASGKKLGEVKRIEGQWGCWYGDIGIAIRPDKTSAQACISRYHEAIKGDSGGQ